MNLLNYDLKFIILSFIDSFESQNLRLTCKEWLSMPKESLFNTNFYNDLMNLRSIVKKELKYVCLADNLDMPYEIPIFNILKLKKMYNQIPISIKIDEDFRRIIEKYSIEKRSFI